MFAQQLQFHLLPLPLYKCRPILFNRRLTRDDVNINNEPFIAFLLAGLPSSSPRYNDKQYTHFLRFKGTCLLLLAILYIR